MPAIDVEELKRVCTQIVREGDLDKLTDRTVRRSAEKLLSLDENALEEKALKQTVKETVATIIAGMSKGRDDSGDGCSDEEVDKDEVRDIESPATAVAAADEANEEADKSEPSDFDEPAAASAKQRKRAPAASKSPQTAKRAKKDDSGGKANKASETTITNLKQYVTKCGLRKVWAKELAGMSGAQQIRHLKDMLSELGMEGRPTLEKCKKIKAKRDLLAELEEIGGDAADAKPNQKQETTGRSRRSGSARSMKVVSDDESESEDEEKAVEEAEDLPDRGSDAAPEDEEGDEESSEESDAYSEGESESEDGKASDDDEAGMDADSD
ncbi:hypothetical protein GGI20_003566 [Coemansia sp. BCRC 34301]|nr:hypothetical protein GGI20_003566 [Coemansia sp. BCRC 34301]